MSGTLDRIDSGTGRVARTNKASRSCGSCALSRRVTEPKCRGLRCCAAGSGAGQVAAEVGNTLAGLGGCRCPLDGSVLFSNTA